MAALQSDDAIPQARELGKHLLGISFAQVLTSPLKRAQQTCALVGLDTPPELEPDLAEWDYGDYEGQRSVDIRKERPDWNIYQDGCPHGEMPAQVSTRADRLLALRLRPSRTLDRISPSRSTTFHTWHGVTQHFLLQSPSP